MSSDTKPCPFCGATGIIFKETDTEKWGAAYCPQCGAAGTDVRTGYNMEPDAPWHKDALEEWNKRAEKYIYSSHDLGAYVKALFLLEKRFSLMKSNPKPIYLTVFFFSIACAVVIWAVAVWCAARNLGAR